MPTYEYKCSSCNYEWEAEHSISRPPLKTCPKCKRRTAKRQISLGGGFILKGGGWYADLYSSAGGKSSSGGSSGSSSSGSGSSGSSGSSSGAAKSDSSKKSSKKKKGKSAKSAHPA